MKLFTKIKTWYENQSETSKTMIAMGAILVILIILRWNFVIDGIKHGFQFFAK